MSENTNNTNLNENENQTPNTSVAAYNVGTDEMPIKLHVLDSNGDTQSIALMQIGNKNMLIDTGIASYAEDHLTELRKLNVNKIDYIYITHYHWDHVGGLPAIAGYSLDEDANGNVVATKIANAGIDISGATVFLPADPESAQKDSLQSSVRHIDNTKAVLAAAGIPNNKIIIPSENNHSFDIGENNELNLEFKNFDVANYYSNGKADDYNNTSLCCIMTYGKTRIGFFGDIGLNAQKNLANTIGHLDLMNVEHHGRNGGHYRPFYDSIAPKMCFTQDGNGNDGNDHILSTMSKTQEYLQENGIPNYPVSENGTTMTFNIYKSGISTTANAAKYAVNFKGATSIFSAVQDNVPGKDRNITLYNLLKNMEHGTFLSCAIRNNNIQLGQLFELLGIAEAEYAEFIAYKNGSIYNNAQLTIDKKLDSGYIMLIPHSENPTCNTITAYWYLDLDKEENPSANIKIVFKPIRDTEHFKFFKSASINSNFETAANFENGFLTCNGLTITPKDSCLVNYSILLRNQDSTTPKAVTINDGESERIITVPAKGYVTLTNVVNLDKTHTISIPTSKEKLENLYVRVSGYVTTQTKTKTKTLTTSDNAIAFPYYGGYPYF